jgi:ankyrin repeat domain-containing protein 50
VVFYYFSFVDLQKQKTLNCLLSLILQLASKLSELPSDLVQFYEDFKSAQPPIATVLTILRTLLDGTSQCKLIVDALDECPQHEQEQEFLLSTLVQMSRWKIPGLHILVTSRRQGQIEDALEPELNVDPVDLRNSNLDDDIRCYVQSQLQIHPKLKKWSAELKQEIEQTLVTGANGMYVYSSPYEPMYLHTQLQTGFVG